MEKGTIPTRSGLWILLPLIMSGSSFLALGRIHTRTHTQSNLNTTQISLSIQPFPLWYSSPWTLATLVSTDSEILLLSQWACWALPEFPLFEPQLGHGLRWQAGLITWLALFISLVSDVIVLCSLIFKVLNVVVYFTVYNFLIVLGGKVNLFPDTPSWLEPKRLCLFSTKSDCEM